MRRVAYVLMLVFCLAPMTAAFGSAASAGGQDYAVGVGGESQQKQFEFSAHSDPGGANPSGFFNAHGDGDDVLDGDIYCLLVSENMATLGIHFTHVSPGNAALLNSYTLAFVQDNGHASPVRDSVESTSFTTYPQPCVPGAANYPIDHGNITVRQASPNTSSLK